MCLISFAYHAHPGFSLVMVANRDEFHARPTRALHWWDDQPDILAGRDLRENGGWLGVNRGGRLAAVTNVRGPDAGLRKPCSRGQLISDYLSSGQDMQTFVRQLADSAQDYGGFNLLLFDGEQMTYASNRPEWHCQSVEPGVHTLSNASLDTPWPKSCRVHRAMEHWLHAGAGGNDQTLIAALGDQQRPEDAQLPNTGVGLELERLLSTPFIRSPAYGTRCTSLLKLQADGLINFTEASFSADGSASGTVRESFSVSGVWRTEAQLDNGSPQDQHTANEPGTRSPQAQFQAGSSAAPRS